MMRPGKFYNVSLYNQDGTRRLIEDVQDPKVLPNGNVTFKKEEKKDHLTVVITYTSNKEFVIEEIFAHTGKFSV